MSSGSVLVTGGGQIALTIARSLYQEDISVDIVNCSPSFHPAEYSRCIEEVYESERSEIVEKINSLTQEQRYTLIIPGDPYTVDKLVQNKNMIEENCSLAVPEEEVFQGAYDKAETARLCEEAEVPTPETKEAEISELGKEPKMNYPFVLKHVNSLGGEGVDLIEDQKDWKEAVKKYRDSYEEDERAILQKYKSGEMICTNVICHGGKVLANCQVERVRELKMGTSSYRRTTDMSDRLKRYTERLMEEMNWEGVAQLQFQKHQGEYYLIEVNGRFWTPLPTAVNAGMNFPHKLFQLYRNNLEIKQKNYSKGVYSRNLIREAEWLISGKPKPQLQKTPRKAVRIAKRYLQRRENIDEAAFEDPLPGIYTLIYLFRRAIITTFVQTA